jgi:SAM-dependent methyltransferase
MYDPRREVLGGFTPVDGSLEFYGRINALLRPEFHVLDLGAGRGAWFFEETSEYKKAQRAMKGKVAEYIGVDVDTAVLSNPTTDRNLLMENNVVPVPDASIDLIICDFVVEHIVDVRAFRREIERILKPGGVFCARTPHKATYFSFMARMVKNANHTRWLRRVQPTRKQEDVFPTAYRCNTLRAVREVFAGWQNFTYLYTAEPAYFFGNKFLYKLMSLVHRIAPPSFTGCLFIFLQKSQAQNLPSKTSS